MGLRPHRDALSQRLRGRLPPVFSSPQAGSTVVEVLPVLRIATTTDAGRHWDLRRLPRAGGAAAPVGQLSLP